MEWKAEVQDIQGSSSGYIKPIWDKCQTLLRSPLLNVSVNLVRSRYSIEPSLYAMMIIFPRFMVSRPITTLLTVMLSILFKTGTDYIG